MSWLWDARKSATLSLVVTWIGLVFAIIAVPLLVPALQSGWITAAGLRGGALARAAGPMYGCLAFGIAALIILLCLLGDIRRGDVFTTANVMRLRLISYCGFAIMLACVVGAVIAPMHAFFTLVALVAGFMGLLMRVIKNVIESARLLKEDADYTI